jgi:thioredoxin 1
MRNAVRSFNALLISSSMKIRALVLLGILCVGPSKQAVAQVRFADGNLQSSLMAAQREHKWVLVDVFATWCGPCHEMDAIYAKSDVAAALASDFIATKKDGERDEGLAIYGKYHVVGFPTLLVLNERGEEVDRIMGSVSAAELIKTLHEFRAGKGTLATLAAAQAKHPAARNAAWDNDEVELAKRYAYRGDARAVSLVDEITRQAPANAHASDALYTLGRYYYLRGAKDYAKAEATLKSVLQKYPDSDEAKHVAYDLAVAYHGEKRDDVARHTLEDWLAAAPTDLSRYNAYAWFCYKNDFDKPRGIAVAKKGLEKDPKSDGLWDTLAELQFASGDAKAAVESEKHALVYKPDDVYYKSQVAKFRAPPIAP